MTLQREAHVRSPEFCFRGALTHAEKLFKRYLSHSKRAGWRDRNSEGELSNDEEEVGGGHRHNLWKET